MASSALFLWISLVCFLSHNLIATSTTVAAAIEAGNTFENQKNYYPPTPAAPSHVPAHVPPTAKGPSLSDSKCPARHRHHSSPRPSCGGTPTPSIPSVSPSRPSPVVVPPPLPRPSPVVTPPLPRPSPVVTPPVVIPPVVNPPVVVPPVLLPPPSPISVPGTPLPPFPFDPNTPPFTCDWWRNHPTIIWGVLGWWGTLGSAFGTTTLPGSSIPGAGSSIPGLPGLPQPTDSLQQALSNTRNDGYGDLYREGVASFLNSVADPSTFPFSTKQVRDSFVAALSSNKAAASQARVFRLANEKKRPKN